MRHGTEAQESAPNPGKADRGPGDDHRHRAVSLPSGAVPVAAPCAISGCQYGNAVPSAELCGIAPERIAVAKMIEFGRLSIRAGVGLGQQVQRDLTDDEEELICRALRNDWAGYAPSATAATWIPVTERLPDDRGPWRVYGEDGQDVTTCHPSWWNTKDPRGSEFDGPEITHWMPLPEVPAPDRSDQ